MDDYITETEIKGVLIIKRPIFSDDRGFFRETFRKNDLEKRFGFEFNPVQANHSRSKKGVLRGIHVAPWHKLITVVSGEVQQVVVDLRDTSPTFGHNISFHLGEGNMHSIFIPANCGNAFLILSNEANYFYLTSDYWSGEKERSVLYNDPVLNIKWETKNPALSAKDLHSLKLVQVYPNKADIFK